MEEERKDRSSVGQRRRIEAAPATSRARVPAGAAALPLAGSYSSGKSGGSILSSVNFNAAAAVVAAAALFSGGRRLAGGERRKQGARDEAKLRTRRAQIARRRGRSNVGSGASSGVGDARAAGGRLAVNGGCGSWRERGEGEGEGEGLEERGRRGADEEGASGQKRARRGKRELRALRGLLQKLLDPPDGPAISRRWPGYPNHIAPQPAHPSLVRRGELGALGALPSSIFLPAHAFIRSLEIPTLDLRSPEADASSPVPFPRPGSLDSRDTNLHPADPPPQSNGIYADSAND
ncbi:unnamed protein product [Diplocarpon coronariae]